MGGETFLNLIESMDRFAVGIFRQFLIKEEGDKVLIITPNEEYKKWATAYLTTKLKGFGKSVIVECEKEAKTSPIASKQVWKNNLLDKYTFDNFVVGPSNELAYKVCVEVSKNPGKLFNPVFLYGRSGLGKTHLLHSIGNRLKQSYNVLYTSLMDFSDAMVKALKENRIEEFRERFLSLDMLLLDDVQFLVGKERTQIELFRIYEKLQAEEKQIILVSDRHPKDLKDVSERLISRFESGLIIEIGLDEETKRRIVKQKLILYGLPLDETTVNYVLENTGYNVREIEGFIQTLKVAGFKPKPNKENVEKKVETVINLVAKSFKLNPELLKKETKERKVINAKYIAMYFCKTMLNLSYVEISNLFGKKDHTSALYAIKKVEQRRTEDRKFQYMISFLEKSLKKSLGL
ncbi:chromosomal replication initiator protein DnaA [Thermocrinis sp.]|uniref:chromosomal replication initiator protein DnaA n=1 Tax=Thermocrinis sp. TaxID=2024383 RepID=UPI002FDD5BFE